MTFLDIVVILKSMFMFLFVYLIWFLYKKRFYNRGTLTNIRISRITKDPTLYSYWLKSFIYIGIIIWVAWKGRGVWKTFTVMQKMLRYLLIYNEISFLYIYLYLEIGLLDKFQYCDSNIGFFLYCSLFSYRSSNFASFFV